MNVRPQLVFSLLLCALGLGACAHQEQRAAPANGVWNSLSTVSEVLRGTDSAEVLAYFQRIKGLSGDALAAENAAVSQALAKRRSDVNRLKLALLLIMPRTAFKDEGRAAALANEVVNNKAADAPEMKNLALLLAAIANEQKQQEERLQQLAQKQKEDEKRADALQQKLDALKSIEKDLIQREQTKTLKTK
jgi:hypothetical protein